MKITRKIGRNTWYELRKSDTSTLTNRRNNISRRFIPQKPRYDLVVKRIPFLNWRITWRKDEVFHQTHYHQCILGLRFTCLSGHLDILHGAPKTKLQKVPLNNTMRDQKRLRWGNDTHCGYGLTSNLRKESNKSLKVGRFPARKTEPLNK